MKCQEKDSVAVGGRVAWQSCEEHFRGLLGDDSFLSVTHTSTDTNTDSMASASWMLADPWPAFCDRATFYHFRLCDRSPGRRPFWTSLELWLPGGILWKKATGCQWLSTRTRRLSQGGGSFADFATLSFPSPKAEWHLASTTVNKSDLRRVFFLVFSVTWFPGQEFNPRHAAWSLRSNQGNHKGQRCLPRDDCRVLPCLRSPFDVLDLSPKAKVLPLTTLHVPVLLKVRDSVLWRCLTKGKNLRSLCDPSMAWPLVSC